MNLYESILNNAKESNKEILTESYKYITSANNPEEIGAEYEYNKYSFNQVLEILNELNTYFAQALEDANMLDQSTYSADIDTLKFCAEKTQDMLNKINNSGE